MGQDTAGSIEDLLQGIDDIDLLIACIRGEAASEQFMGKLSVGCVIRNRVYDARWPNTYPDVMLQPYQFTCFLPEYFRPEILHHDWGRLDYRECRYAAWGVYYGWIRDITDGATHYWNPDIATPKWAPGLTWLDKVGDHQFARE